MVNFGSGKRPGTDIWRTPWADGHGGSAMRQSAIAVRHAQTNSSNVQGLLLPAKAAPELDPRRRNLRSSVVRL
jgi:hypothetical protein